MKYNGTDINKIMLNGVQYSSAKQNGIELLKNYHIPADNLIANGDVENGLTGLLATNGTLSSYVSETERYFTVTGNGTAAYFNAYWLDMSDSLAQMVPNNEYYFGIEPMTEGVLSSVRLYIDQTGGTNVQLNNPTSGIWLPRSSLSKVFTYTGSARSVKFMIQAVYANSATANGKTLKFRKGMVFDLTARYGTGVHDKTWCDANITYP